MPPRKRSEAAPASTEKGDTLALLLEQAPRRGSTADLVTDVLREAILGGQIAASSWLREEELATELRVSRTPVREAIRRLNTEGLAVRVPNQGAQVAPMNLEDILAVYAVRENLEGMAARVAAQHASPLLDEQLIEIQDGFEAAAGDGDVARMVTANLEFHRAIREASRNPYLQRFLTLVEHSVRRFGRSTFESPDRISATISEHRAIMAAIASGQADEAETCARQHMRRARESRLESFLRAYS
jgi:DNA-binding GntR family transcriptional regulator